MISGVLNSVRVRIIGRLVFAIASNHPRKHAENLRQIPIDKIINGFTTG